MPKIQPPKIRLALPGSPAPEVFNFYQIISLISALYIKVSDREDIDTYKKAWEFARDSLLSQVGEVFNLWHAAQKGGAGDIPIPEDQILIDRTSRFALRLVAFEEHLSVWTPISRWARVLHLIEVKLMRLAAQIGEHNPYVARQLSVMLEGMKLRQASIFTILSTSLAEEMTLRSNFAIPVAL